MFANRMRSSPPDALTLLRRCSPSRSTCFVLNFNEVYTCFMQAHRKTYKQRIWGRRLLSFLLLGMFVFMQASFCICDIGHALQCDSTEEVILVSADSCCDSGCCGGDDSCGIGCHCDGCNRGGAGFTGPIADALSYPEAAGMVASYSETPVSLYLPVATHPPQLV